MAYKLAIHIRKKYVTYMKERINYIVTENDQVKKGDLQCRSCKKSFNHADLTIKKTERFGLIIDEKVCPYCGSHTYGLKNYPFKEEELLYKDFYHRNYDRKLIKALDKLTEEIIADDLQKHNEKIFVKRINEERMAMA